LRISCSAPQKTAASGAYHKAFIVLALMIPMFLVAFPIFASPQFLLSKGNANFLRNRIHSIIDLGETSNGTRLMIWRASIDSIRHNPLLGVGIGNFPVVLGQSIMLARAGSTAHNLYLHIPAEMGIPAGLVAFATLVLIGLRSWWWSLQARDTESLVAALTTLSLLWMYIYVGTDPIIFDERILLLFGVIVALTSHAHATTTR
jgi:O-antigen ligase